MDVTKPGMCFLVHRGATTTAPGSIEVILDVTKFVDTLAATAQSPHHEKLFGLLNDLVQPGIGMNVVLFLDSYLTKMANSRVPTFRPSLCRVLTRKLIPPRRGYDRASPVGARTAT